MLQRALIGSMVTRMLGFRPSSTDDLKKAAEAGAPQLLLNPNLWSLAADMSPNGTWLEVIQHISDVWADPSGRDQLVAQALARLAPVKSEALSRLLTSQMTPQESDDLIKSLVTPDNIKSGVSKLLNGPEALVRCLDCGEPYFSDGSKACPFCKD